MKFVSLVVLVAIVMFCLPAFAETTWTSPYVPLTSWLNDNDIDHMHGSYEAPNKNWADAMGDILTGKRNTYFRGEAVKAFDLKKPLFGLDRIEVGIYTKIELSKPVSNARYYEGGPSVRLIW